MSSANFSTNHVLTSLSASDRELLQPHLLPGRMAAHDYFHRAGQPIDHVYFVEAGIISVVAKVPSGEEMEIGIVGPDGFTGTSVLLDVQDSPFDCFCQVAGSFNRIATSQLVAASDASPALRKILLNYVHSFMVEMARTAVANGRHTVEQRLARWLLLCQDRVGDTVPLTHAFLAVMLGVHRPSVTVALQILEGSRAIRNSRALVTILDREKLEAVATSRRPV